jgi:L-lactate dehydrogenase complex protein LldG
MRDGRTVDRDAFLLRAAVGTFAEAPTADPGPLVPEGPTGDLLKRFCDELTAAAGTPHPVHTVDEALEVVLDLMQGHRTFMARGNLPVPGLAGRLIHDGYHIVNSDVPTDPAERRRHQLEYESLEVGITGVDGLLAESGSIVVTSGREAPRMASLIPETHIALATTDQMYRSLSHFLFERPDTVTNGSNMVVITGPSRTGDIEQTITLGVHGPRTLHVVLLPPRSPR